MPKYKFGDLVYNIAEKRSPVVGDEELYIGLEHLDSGSLRVTRWGSKVALKGDKLVMRKGDILFGRRNTYLRRVAIAPHDGLFSAHGMILRAKTERINSEYLPFFIASDYFMDEAIRISVGSLSPTVNWKELKELEFTIPTLEAQEKLTKTLIAANDLKEKYEELLAITDDLVKSQFIELFESAEKSFPECTIIEACANKDDIKCGPFGTQLKQSEYTESGVAVWGIPEINKEFQKAPEIFITPDKANQLSPYSLIPGDIAMSRKGNVGQCAIYEGPYTYPDEEYFDELSAGHWGFIDKYGKVVIEPQYVFTTGFRHYENRAFVAKDVGGKTLWGLIDEKGNEVIPCIYPNLGTHSGTAVNFQRSEHGDYGIMDFDGNIIMEPRYDSIYEYDEKHGLIAFFLDWSEGHHVGIARVSDGEIIIPAKYGYIGFEDNYIECEKEYWTDTETMCDYYDYEGNLLPNDSCKHSWKCEGGYGSWNSQHKCGAVDENNNIIVPFIFEDSSHIGYYQRGYIVTGTKGKFGLSTRNGKVMLAEKYRDITLKDDFIIASYRNDANWDIIDELYLLDGTPVFTDTYRRVSIDGDKLTRETPLGLEHYRIVRN